VEEGRREKGKKKIKENKGSSENLETGFRRPFYF